MRNKVNNDTSDVQEPQATVEEPDYKTAFEIAANQRDRANHQLCNLQIDLAIAKRDIEVLKGKIAELENFISNREKKAAGKTNSDRNTSE